MLKGLNFFRIISVMGLCGWLLWMWAIEITHLGVFPRSALPPLPSSLPEADLWIRKDRPQSGAHHHLVLSGSPLELGLKVGAATKDLLSMQEASLYEKLSEFLPSPLIQHLFFTAATRWFWGLEEHLEPWMIEEMYGVSRYADSKMNKLADPLTRQVAYHGLHEVGQMVVDQGEEDGFGCTVVALKKDRNWILGRNFDFEGGRIFDDEKILKWVFPKSTDTKQDPLVPYVSVIWAGMVGAVTGVNQEGIYVSINAAGSRDFVRTGLPSTLLVTKVLQSARNVEQALSIFKSTDPLITEIYVLLDAKSGRLFRIEKSPKHTEVIEEQDAVAITNHLISERWKSDRLNRRRRDDQTSSHRLFRAQALIEKATYSADSVLKILRDKGADPAGNPLYVGNRRAIDALIATHAVIFDTRSRTFYVSQGRSLSGKFTGYDLEKSFANRRPIITGSLPQDPEITALHFAAKEKLEETFRKVRPLLKNYQCEEAKAALIAIKNEVDFMRGNDRWNTFLGDAMGCLSQFEDAISQWESAIKLQPAYAWQIKLLRSRIEWANKKMKEVSK